MMVSPVNVSDTQGVYAVLDAVLTRYRSVQVVIVDSAYDREGLLEWSLGKWEVGLDCVGRSGGGKGFVVSSRRWLVERSFAWLFCCRHPDTQTGGHITPIIAQNQGITLDFPGSYLL